MKHDAWRHDLGRYDFTFEIPTRYSDVDTLRHLNNSALSGLHQEARHRFLVDRLGDAFWRARGPRLLSARVTTEFLLESQYPQAMQAAVRTTALDQQTLTLASALFQDGHCVGLQQAQLAASDRGQVIDLPPTWVSALGTLEPALASDRRSDKPVPPALSQFVQRGELDTRYADLDATGRISELALMRSSEQGRSTLLRAAFATLGDSAERAWLGMLVARVDLHLLQHAPLPPRWQLGSGVGHLGRSSVVLRVAFFDQHAHCAAYADSVLVFVDRKAGKPVAMPDVIRQLLDQQRLLAP